MPKEKDRKDYDKPASTFIGTGITLKAQKLSGSEAVRIDGLFLGDINLEGYLQVGEPGRIEGNLQVSYALIAGEVFGDIVCRATVHLSSTARVHGNITTGRIIMDEGSIFYGVCQTRDEVPKIVSNAA
ncbi:MAG: polymer-forming cytoskeletal protein [Defluviitaleaceae bacterium]|nr:polymer-forming cytoskeletal protein [Defluviitaleaceae bacterium]